MKKCFLYAFAAMAAVSALTSCGDNDDPNVPGSGLEQKSYTSANGLTLSLNGQPVAGKSVTFSPAADGTATITLAGEPFDLSGIFGGETKADQTDPLTFPTSGVLPGSPSTEIKVTLTGDASNCSFEGDGETDYCTFSYQGNASGDALEFALSDVKLKNTSLAGTWELPSLSYIDPDWGYESKNLFNVARAVWKSQKNFSIQLSPDSAPLEMPAGTILQMTLAMPLMQPDEDGNPTMSVADMLALSLNTVTFGEDGSLTARYLDSKTGEMTDAPAGLAQYVVDGDGTLRLFLNPGAIIANAMAPASKSTRAADLTIVVESLLQQLVPMLSNGIPLCYGDAFVNANGDVNPDSAVKAFYLGTKTLKPILTAVAPLFSDKEFVDGIVNSAAQDPAMKDKAPMLSGILTSLPDVINGTETIELGINLKK
ncbi:MAG: hypothetical protein K2M27_04175 [Muribaculaceae bacterium]|nr:hypothetical protein [Muribaculaceae bacterium]